MTHAGHCTVHHHALVVFHGHFGAVFFHAGAIDRAHSAVAHRHVGGHGHLFSVFRYYHFTVFHHATVLSHFARMHFGGGDPAGGGGLGLGKGGHTIVKKEWQQLQEVFHGNKVGVKRMR